ncbi:glycoside hydrolase family 18 protein [Amanita thiersii Skay4041]|uniref:Glycoside hydrolase family 18 protein n=1 Tax=Amanita thiersii Skay4041 TaxID=703135 RepID=A0A2A9NRS8_9AGAR|nr:glycoside hydrolase family 18 protein [Amanita thiersii Skay4041]
MLLIKNAVIHSHTTYSSPSPHILYIISVTLEDGTIYNVARRYSQFVTLQHNLKDTYSLPPKRILTTATHISNTWIHDSLISERKAGLSAYLFFLLSIPGYRKHPVLREFLSPGDSTAPKQMSDFGQPGIAHRPAGASQPIVASYYPSWCSDERPPETIDFSKFDILFFAFATPNSSLSLDWDDGGKNLLKRLVSCARGSGMGTKIVLSIGGWGGCSWWCNAVATEDHRIAFRNNVIKNVKELGLDGIDIDWEYPNSPGAGNPYSSTDTPNLLKLVKMLRVALGESKILSAAVSHLPWTGPGGDPLNNVSEFANVMTYVNIMNYDVFGASPNPGPNAPLGNPCGTSQQPEATAQAALSQWTKAGMPVNKLMLGLPLYGYVSKSVAKRLHGSSIKIESNRSRKGAHRNYKMPARKDGDLSNFWGQQIAFNQLVESGVLVKGSDGNYRSGQDYTMGWDDCSDTPYLFNVKRSTVISYDDTWSLGDKAVFAAQSGMAGCFTWSLDQDDGMALQNRICAGLGRHAKRVIDTENSKDSHW